MDNISIGVPLATKIGARSDFTRRFSGADVPMDQMTAFIAKIVREGLEATAHPERELLKGYSDSWLADQVELVTAVPDEVWERHGLFAYTGWEVVE